jgi:hypothetical protein
MDSGKLHPGANCRFGAGNDVMKGWGASQFGAALQLRQQQRRPHVGNIFRPIQD